MAMKDKYCKANLELALDLLRKAKTQTDDLETQRLIRDMIVQGERAWQRLTPAPAS